MTYNAPVGAWGPWLGVRKERRAICAIDGCDATGKPQRCPADGNMHNHGCVHYEGVAEALCITHGLRLRHGWGLLCDEHCKVIADLFSGPRK